MVEHLKLIKEEVEKTITQVEADWAKSAFEKEEAKKTKAPIFKQVLGYTEVKVIINGRSTSVHRVFVKALDSGSYTKLGWVLSNDVKHCMICSKELVAYLLSWSPHRLHCHACGNIICPDCSPADAAVEGLESVGPVPVCNQCYFGQVRELIKAYKCIDSFYPHPTSFYRTPWSYCCPAPCLHPIECTNWSSPRASRPPTSCQPLRRRDPLPQPQVLGLA